MSINKIHELRRISVSKLQFIKTTPVPVLCFRIYVSLEISNFFSGVSGNLNIKNFFLRFFTLLMRYV